MPRFSSANGVSKELKQDVLLLTPLRGTLAPAGVQIQELHRGKDGISQDAGVQQLGIWTPGTGAEMAQKRFLSGRQLAVRAAVGSEGIGCCRDIGDERNFFGYRELPQVTMGYRRLPEPTTTHSGVQGIRSTGRKG